MPGPLRDPGADDDVVPKRGGETYGALSEYDLLGRLSLPC